MAYPNLLEKDDDVKIELTDPTEERRQIGFDGLSEKATTPTGGSETLQLLTDKTESRPRLNTAERVSMIFYKKSCVVGYILWACHMMFGCVRNILEGNKDAKAFKTCSYSVLNKLEVRGLTLAKICTDLKSQISSNGFPKISDISDFLFQPFKHLIIILCKPYKSGPFECN